MIFDMMYYRKLREMWKKECRRVIIMGFIFLHDCEDCQYNNTKCKEKKEEWSTDCKDFKYNEVKV